MKIGITPINTKSIELKLLRENSLISTLKVQGKYKRGYFRVKRKQYSKFIAGPLLWIMGDNFKYIGLTKKDDLVILNSGSGGVLIALVLPIFAAGSGQYENVYIREK